MSTVAASGILQFQIQKGFWEYGIHKKQIGLPDHYEARLKLAEGCCSHGRSIARATYFLQQLGGIEGIETTMNTVFR